jgi:hypothetical protein
MGAPGWTGVEAIPDTKFRQNAYLGHLAILTFEDKNRSPKGSAL